MLQALALLHRIAKQVQPVMRKRGWRVPLLSEFSPKSPNLLVLSLPQTQCHLDASLHLLTYGANRQRYAVSGRVSISTVAEGELLK